MSKPMGSIAPTSLRRISFVIASVLFSAILFSVTARTPLRAQAPVTFDKTFGPDTIGPGSVSTLSFTIDNISQDSVTDLAFTDNLPDGVTIAKPSNASTTCTDGIVTAPDGGDTITFSDGRLGPGSSCGMTVDVTSSTPDTHTNTSGALTSSAGSHGTATADLTVATSRPGFSKAFSPDAISLGSRSTLTFTIDNTANDVQAYSLSFTDNLPAGLIVADPPNVSNTCAVAPFTGGVVTAVPGTDLISLAYGGGLDYAAVDAGGTCTISVDVTTTGSGLLGNTTGELISNLGSSGKASAVLEVSSDPLSLIKSFTDDPVPSGGTATLEFTITNFNRSETATNVAFTDDLNAALSDLEALGLPQSNPCGSGSQLTGTSTLALTGGSLTAGASCTFSVTLQVPAAATAGSYVNTTSSITGDVGGSQETGSPASDTLFVAAVPLLTKSFTDDPVATGDAVTLEFTLTNTSSTSGATDIAFEDELTTFLPYPVSATLPSAGFCGVGSSMSLIGTDTHSLSMIGGSLAAGASCTFSVTLEIPEGLSGGTFTNTTSNVTATIDGQTVTGDPAADDLVVAAAPTFSKAFTDDPVAPGDTVTLEFSLSQAQEAPSSATDIAFTDDLNAALSGLTATGLPQSDVCGAGSEIDGTTYLSFTGGSLMPGESCAFSVTLQVPADAGSGSYTNQTSNITATVSGLTTVGNLAQDDLNVTGLSMTKSFPDDTPVIPGDTVTLAFTISNTHPISDATAIAFTDNLDDMLSGLVAVGLPQNDICGTGSQIDGTDLLTFSGGNLAAGSWCTFSVTLQIPAGTASDTYNNTTSNVSANLGSSAITLDPATDKLTVSSDWLFISKSFADDPVAPDEIATLAFTINNLHETRSAANIAFTDNLDAALSGLVGVGLPANDICGTGSQIDGTDTLTFSGGNLAPGASCAFSVTLQVPATAGSNVYVNTTDQITGTIDGLAVSGNIATDDLHVMPLDFSKSFDGPVTAGSMVALEFTIQNLGTGESVSDISFSDDLDAVLSGLSATGLPAINVCGAGSEITGTSSLSLRTGSLEADASCTFSITLQVPPTALPGSYVNTTSDLLSGELLAGFSTTATLIIEPQKVYLPLVLYQYLAAPDLVVQNLTATTNDVSVTILNQGNAAVTDEFWVDVYIDPSPAPTTVNQTWPELADEGLVWGVTTTIQPGEVITLTVGDAYYVAGYSDFSWPLDTGTPVYVQVDSAADGSGYGAVQENHEITGGTYNNIGSTTVTTVAADALDMPLPIDPSSLPGGDLPPR